MRHKKTRDRIEEGRIKLILECEHCGHEEEAKTTFATYANHYDSLVETYKHCFKCGRK